MEIRILKEDELANAAGLSRYVFDNCLRNRMEFPQTIAFIEEYVCAENILRLYREEKLTLWGTFYQEQLIAASGLQSDGMITMLYVLPQFQKQRIGRNMLLAMREFARDRYGFEKVLLNAAPAWTSFYFANQGFSCIHPKQSVRVPFVSMHALSNQIDAGRKEKITGKTIALAVLACLGFATIAGCLFMIGYLT